MNKEKDDYIRYRMERASQSLQVAKSALESGLLNDAVNRIYYACFYAVSALLITRDLFSSKHSGVRSLFSQHFVKNGPFPRDLSRFYHDLFESRQNGDYEDFVTFKREDVEAWLAQAEQFVVTIAKYIENELSAGSQE